METDYLIIGAGATALCFADQLLTDSDATMTIVDRRAAPGGHWVDAYPFVQLHQPASFYGVNSAHLGTDKIATSGPNEGLMSLASGTTVLHHLGSCMEDRLLPSGRVTYLPLHEVTEDRMIRSLLSGETQNVVVRKRIVDARYFENAVPQTHRANIAIDPDIRCITPNALPREAPGHNHFLVVGAGKTGIDSVLFLLQSGASPDQISWVMPRDSWLWDRETTQPSEDFFEKTIGGFASQMQSAATATDPDDFALKMEEAGVWMRIDPDVTPQMFHAATCTRKELAMLRRVTNIIRMGRVTALEPGRLTLEGGSVALPPGTLAVDCCASAISKKPPVKIFDGDTITCQMVRFPAVTFSAAFLGHLEATLDNDDEKNRFAAPVPLPDTPADYMMTLLVGMMNQGQWRQSPELSAFMDASRLDPFSSLITQSDLTAPGRAEILEKIQSNLMPALGNLQRLATPPA